MNNLDLYQMGSHLMLVASFSFFVLLYLCKDKTVDPKCPFWHSNVSTEESDSEDGFHFHTGCQNVSHQQHSFSGLHATYLTLRMASAQVAKTSVANNSPSQGSSHPDDHHFLIKDFPTVLKWGHSFLMLVVNLFTQNGFPIDK